MQSWELERELGKAQDKLNAIKTLTEPFLDCSGRFWRVKQHFHHRHRDYISDLMNILEEPTSEVKTQ